MTNDPVKIVHSIPEAARPGVLGKLLDQRRSASGSILAFGARMGQAPSYIASVPLGWVAQHVRFAGEMPEFAGRVDDASKNIQLDSFTIGHIVQRSPDWRRQRSMTAYLAAWGKHKFPPLLIVGREKWVGDPDSEHWDTNGKAEQESVSTTPLGRGLYELTTGGANFYALDGQHRLMAIQGLQTLIDERRLPGLDQNRRPKGKELDLRSVARIIEEQGGEKLDASGVIAKLRGVMSEEIGVEIIPAVLKGESDEEAKFRLRSVFVDVNESAKKLTAGESVLLDEKSGFRMAARKVMVTHPLLKGRVFVKSTSRQDFSKEYTTLQTLERIAEVQLGHRDEFKAWGKRLIPGDKPFMCRPKSESEIEAGSVQLYSYFGGLSRLPSHVRMMRGESDAVLREQDEGHILFRPVAQLALAEASAILDRDHDIFMDVIVEELIRQEKRGQLKLKDPKAPWCGVIWDSNSGEMQTKVGERKLCMRLFVYLLGGKLDEQKLRDDFSKARRTYGGDPDLPAPWR